MPTADLRAAGARYGADTVTFYYRTATAPTAGDIASGNYTFTSTVAGLRVRFDTRATIADDDAFGGQFGVGDTTPECLAYFGPGGGPAPAAIAGNAATGELSATFSRADVNAQTACSGGGAPSAGSQVRVDGAMSEYRDPPRGLLGGGIARDTAEAGPVTTLSN